MIEFWWKGDTKMEIQPNQVQAGDQLLITRDDRLQLRTPTGPNKYMVKAECEGFRGGIWGIAQFLSSLSGLSHETFRLPTWATATAAVFLEKGQTATEEQKIVAR